MRYLLQNAQILSSGGVFRAADVLLSGGRIVSIGDRISCPADAVSIDLHKAVLFPGFVDVHVHLREPGFSYKETIRTGTLAAAHGGFVHVAAMPNLDPVPDCAAALAVQRAIIEKDALVHVHPYGAISVGEKGERLADLEGLAPGVIAFSDDCTPRTARTTASCTAAISTTARMPAPTATAASAPRASGGRSPGTSGSPSRPAAHTTSATSPRRKASPSSAQPSAAAWTSPARPRRIT